jgi:hypothetical protein
LPLCLCQNYLSTPPTARVPVPVSVPVSESESAAAQKASKNFSYAPSMNYVCIMLIWWRVLHRTTTPQTVMPRTIGSTSERYGGAVLSARFDLARSCVRACVGACVRACVRACVCACV